MQTCFAAEVIRGAATLRVVSENAALLHFGGTVENQDDIINQILEQQKELKRMAKHIEHGLKLMKSKLDAAIEQREHWTYHEAAPMQS